MEVAISVAEGSLGVVLEKLQLLAAECSRIKGLPRQMSFLRSELAAMQALLLKVAAMEEPVDVQVQAWAREVREMAYDVEDCVDAFSRQQRAASSRGRGGAREFFSKCGRLLKTLRSWRQFADQIDELKARVVEAGERRERYKLDDIAARGDTSNSGVDPRLAAIFADEDHLVGIDGPRDELVRWLTDEGGSAKQRKVLSIVGFGGLGKTTLANQVYLKIGGDFLCKAFLSVSQKPNLRLILRDCLLQLCHDREFIKDIGEWDEKKIITMMREYLVDKRYLIVIDDVWSTSAWDAIKCAFPGNTCRSRIITTTRINDVARSCSCTDGRVYEMEPLSDLYSKRLFTKRIFGSEECPYQFQEVSDEILKKCGGLPLAIISISGLLANKPLMKEEWEKVRNSIGSALARHRNLEGIKAILTLSYNDLPHHLKTCLLYLSMFPEDCNIERRRLINRWIAEGFISQERGQSVQDVAETYFFELINKSMVLPVDIGYDGKARACRVHDIMLELIISKATEENFVTIIGSQASVAYPKCNIRRLSILQADQDLASILEDKDVSHARSLVAFGSVNYLPRLVQFQVLRVLDFEGCMDLEEYDLTNIDKLTQLMYLSLRDTDISDVPSGVLRLHDLQTLDLRRTNIVELPAGIVRLKKLQNILVKKWDRRIKVPNGIGNMRNLQVLSEFNIYRSSLTALEDLSKLTNLMELQIELTKYQETKRHEEVLLSSLCKLGTCKLQYLSIHSSDASPIEFLDSWSPLPCSLRRFRMATSYYLLSLPKWLAPELTSLAYLDINLKELKQEELDLLGELRALLCLRLWFKNTCTNQMLTVRRLRGFHCLKELVLFRGMEYHLVFETGAAPKLEKLEMPFSVSAAKGHDFIIGLEHLPCLKYAEVLLFDEGATSYETTAAAAAVRNEANANPNHPRVIIHGEWEDEEDDCDTSGDKRDAQEVVVEEQSGSSED
ncbi:unnamed protein product [Urochloa decumbens]|uniref:Uncharacterized protein n=1 Tax=Urochloa decumbens TaxID=240449 RepID=A0ABC8WYS2_9POAL